MIQDIFVEQTVKRREIGTLKPMYYVSFVLMVLNIFCGVIFLFPLFLIPGLMFAFMCWWINSNMRLEFDYNYTNGELDIARVRAGAKRKELCNISQGDLIVMAPAQSEPVRKYIGSRMKTFDCTSHNPNMSYYVLIYKNKKDGNTRKVLFEPKEELVDMLKRQNIHTVYKRGEI